MKPPEPKRGRKPRNEKPATHQIAIRLTEAEFAYLKILMKSYEFKTISSFIRFIIGSLD